MAQMQRPPQPSEPPPQQRMKQLIDLGYPPNVVAKDLRKKENQEISSSILPDLPQEEMKNMDSLNLGNDAAILKLLKEENDGKETVILSEKLTKINRKGKKQERYIMITQCAIYNLLPKKYKKAQRRVAIQDIGMVTLSSSGSEFAIHVPSSYDYHFISDHKDHIATVLQGLYAKQNTSQLKVVYSELKHLQDLIFTKTLAKYEDSKTPQSPIGSMSDDDNMDSQNLQNNPEIRSLIAVEGLGEQETVVLSEKVTKINRKGRNQERYLMITQHAVYNLIPQKYEQSKRRVQLKDIGMVTMSSVSPEFAIHVPNEYDYHLASKQKYVIVQCLSEVYKKQTNDELIIVESELKHLKDLILTKTLAKYEGDGSKEAMQQTINSMHKAQSAD